MVNRGGWAALALVVLAWPAWAVDELTPDGELLEELLEDPSVTAETVVVGLSRHLRDGEAPGLRGILARIPPGERGAGVCVRVATADGRYVGRIRYRDEGGSEPLAALPYESEHEEIYRADLRPGVLVTPCPTAAEPGGAMRIAVARWMAAEGQALSDHAELAINSLGADRAAVRVAGELTECERVGTGHRLAFDFRCAIPADRLDDGAVVEVLRARGMVADPPIRIEVIAP